MNWLFLFGSLMFFIYPLLAENKRSFIDYYILFCLYFDATAVFYQPPLIFSQGVLTAFAFAVYFLNYRNKMTKEHRTMFWLTLFFLSIILLSSVIQDLNLGFLITNLLRVSASLAILPVAFHYYSTRGSINILLRSGYYFLVVWTLIVILFSFFQVDHVYDPTSTWTHMGAETFGGGVIYFGNMGRRGAITYIAFALLLTPLLYSAANRKQRLILYLCSGFILAVLFISLKRFSLVVLVLGVFSYFLRSKVSVAGKISASLGIVGAIVLLYNLNVFDLTIQQYEQRGAEAVYSLEAVEGDIRFVEPIYVIKHVFSGTPFQVFFGRESERIIDIDDKIGWQVHNQYAQYLLLYGFVGLFSYLYLFYFLYKKTNTYKKYLMRSNININNFWIVFQNLIIIFIISGMVGGHIHITFRSLVLLFAGGISGYFYKLLKEETKKTT